MAKKRHPHAKTPLRNVFVVCFPLKDPISCVSSSKTTPDPAVPISTTTDSIPISATTEPIPISTTIPPALPTAAVAAISPGSTASCTPPEDVPRACPTCTFHNTAEALCCAVCGVPLPSASPNVKGCPVCSFDNPASATKCQLCESPLAECIVVQPTAVVAIPHGAVTQSSHSAAFVKSCPACSFDNPASATKCQLCESPLTDCVIVQPADVAALPHNTVIESSNDAALVKSCPVCSFDNPASATKCQLCESSLANCAVVQPTAGPTLPHNDNTASNATSSATPIVHATPSKNTAKDTAFLGIDDKVAQAYTRAFQVSYFSRYGIHAAIT